MINIGLYVFGKSAQYSKYYQMELLLKYLSNDSRFRVYLIIDGTSKVESKVISDFDNIEVYDLRSHELSELSYFNYILVNNPYDKPYYSYKYVVPYTKLVCKMYGCSGVELNSESLYHRTLVNNSSVIIVENDYTKSLIDSIKYRGSTKNKKVLTYSPAFDYVYDKKLMIEDTTNYPNDKLNIIWSPHHTVYGYKYAFKIDGGLYSTFDYYKDTIIKLQNKYSDKAKFHFVPHPLLFGSYKKSYHSDLMDFINKLIDDGWDYNPTSEFNYYTMFNNCDLIINDCISYTLEWLPINKPMIVLNTDSKASMSSYGNWLVKNCYYESNNTNELTKLVDDFIKDKDKFDVKRIVRDKIINSLYYDRGKPNCKYIADKLVEFNQGMRVL